MGVHSRGWRSRCACAQLHVPGCRWWCRVGVPLAQKALCADTPRERGRVPCVQTEGAFCPEDHQLTVDLHCIALCCLQVASPRATASWCCSGQRPCDHFGRGTLHGTLSRLPCVLVSRVLRDPGRRCGRHGATQWIKRFLTARQCVAMRRGLAQAVCCGALDVC